MESTYDFVPDFLREYVTLTLKIIFDEEVKLKKALKKVIPVHSISTGGTCFFGFLWISDLGIRGLLFFPLYFRG